MPRFAFNDVDGQIPAMSREIYGIPTTNGKVELLGQHVVGIYMDVYIYIYIHRHVCVFAKIDSGDVHNMCIYMYVCIYIYIYIICMYVM